MTGPLAPRPAARLTVLVAGTALTALLAVPALGDDREEALGSLPESAWSQSITPLDDGITPLAENITALGENIIPLDTRTTEGEETVISLASDILFDFGEAQIDAAAEEKITELVADVPDGAIVQVHGHTDSISGRDFNQQLSEERAARVADVVAQARPDLELQVEGFGMDEPVEPNEIDGEDNPEGRALNRRVEIRYDG